MNIDGEDVAIMAGVVAILGASMKFLQYMFSKFSKIESHDERLIELENAIKSVKDSEIKEIRDDIRKLENDFQELKNAVQTAIVEGNASIEKTVSELHIKLLDKITAINK